ncbi:MAG: hypothetical protein JWL68_3487 [Actinomycetia bacterium]|nr:hypothetical protein [Actinomycetes bacterium]
MRLAIIGAAGRLGWCVAEEAARWIIVRLNRLVSKPPSASAALAPGPSRAEPVQRRGVQRRAFSWVRS